MAHQPPTTSSAASADVHFTWQLEPTTCDHCAAGPAETDLLIESPDRLLGTPQRFRLARCSRCDLARLDPRPTAANLDAAYAAMHVPAGPPRLRGGPRGLLRWALTNARGYPLGRPMPEALRWLAWPAFAAALRGKYGRTYLPWQGEGRLLDFGCGQGEFLATMVAAGWKAEGLDLSPDAVDAAAERGLKINLGTLPGADLPGESYDVLTLWQSLEHVPSPSATLHEARRLLRPGGRLLVCVPQLDGLTARAFGPAWYPLGLPLHLTHFTRATLARHVAAAGFEVEAVRSAHRRNWTRRSFALAAEDTGRAVHRRLSRSRFVIGLIALAARLTGRGNELTVMARRPN